jgi:hypothetical protein
VVKSGGATEYISPILIKKKGRKELQRVKTKKGLSVHFLKGQKEGVRRVVLSLVPLLNDGF